MRSASPRVTEVCWPVSPQRITRQSRSRVSSKSRTMSSRPTAPASSRTMTERGESLALVRTEAGRRLVTANDRDDGLDGGVDRANQIELSAENVAGGKLRADPDEAVIIGQLRL